jgi:DNA-binding NarL/FixJ family response regulator
MMSVTKKILIVDDSELLQIRLRKALIKANESLIITQAYNYHEALEQFHSFHPATVILDIALPDGSGMVLLQIFKKEDPKVVVAMLTNYPNIEFKDSCLTFGADHFYEKSEISELVHKITMN